jgi:hypothetical protein
MDLYEALFIMGQHPKVAAIDFVEHDCWTDKLESQYLSIYFYHKPFTP